jgi:hypothetical protein
MIYQFKITLKGVSPAIWREIQVDSTMFLDELHFIFQTAMLWSAEFGYAFDIDGKSYGESDEDEPTEDLLDAPEFQIEEVFKKAGQTAAYRYDEWEFEVALTKTMEPAEGVEYPVCTDGARNSPFEECGNPDGYAAFLELLQDTGNPERAQLIEDIGGEFDPDAFDAEDINEEFSDPDNWEGEEEDDED